LFSKTVSSHTLSGNALSGNVLSGNALSGNPAAARTGQIESERPRIEAGRSDL
jgi:hypothetical protein